MAARRLRRIAIIGGGLGGLLAAQAMRDSGLEVTVYERDMEHGARPQGYQIGLNETGLQALKQGGVKLQGLCDGSAIDGVKIVSHKLGVMMEFQMPKSAPRVVAPGSTSNKENDTDKVDSWLLDRWKLRHLLTQDINIVWNKQFVRYQELSDGVRVFFADGTSIEADFVIGADGAKSLVRQQRRPELVREPVGVCGITGFLPVSQAPALAALAQHSLVRILAPRGLTMLLITFSDPRSPERNILWSMTHPKGFVEYPEELAARHAMAVSLTRDMHPDLQAAVQQTPLENMLPPHEYHSLRVLSNSLVAEGLGKSCRVTLLGDAAHPMTTHAGLGANTAFADAIDIATALKQQFAAPELLSGADPASWETFVSSYERKLMKRGNDAVKTSLRSTRTIHANSFFAVLARNTMVRAIGSAMASYRAVKRHPLISAFVIASAIGSVAFWAFGRRSAVPPAQ